jgi:oxygen-independent coproporphyrinogen-3 oxidase
MLGLYIHIPFCRQKCYYCDFFSIKYDVTLADKYTDALISHISQFANKKISSIYIGGGTPSVLSLEQIRKLLQALRKNFNLHKICEFTFELNPESVSKDKLHLLKQFGADRLSIGLESVKDSVLNFLGRAHNFKTFCDVYDMARRTGFDNINVDLIYGFPGQTLKDWERVLSRVLTFSCQHLSLYPLSIEEKTPFYKAGFSTNDDIQRDMYDMTVEILAKNGYIHYEISNWAKDGKQSFHNSNYWRNFEYIGIGAGASGYLERNRYKNIENIEEYIKLSLPLQNTAANNRDNLLEIEKEYISDKLYKSEKIMLGLRLLNEGVDAGCFDNQKHQAALLECLKDKTLEKYNNRVKLAKEAVFVYNQIVLKFV